MCDFTTIKQELDEVWHDLFDYNHYEVLTTHGWKETWIISVHIGKIIMIEVANPEYPTWLVPDKEGARQVAPLVLYGIDEASKYLRRSTKDEEASIDHL